MAKVTGSIVPVGEHPKPAKTRCPMPNEPLPLYPGARACIHSGYCCRQGPCAFGEWDEQKKQCAHLTKDDHCAIYHEIINRPVEEWYWNPAFGAGCCSPGNPDRAAMLKRDPALAQRHLLRPPVGDTERGRDVSGDGQSAGRRAGSGSGPSGVRPRAEGHPKPLGD